MIPLTLNSVTQFINSYGVKIAYNVEGSGPPLLLLHGGMGSKKDWSTYGYFQALRDKYTLIAIDHRGHGESGKPTKPDEYSIEVLTRDILSIADACGLERFYVMGFSYGGSIALQLAASSKRVIKLIAIGASLGSVLTPGFVKFNNGLITFWEPLLEDLKVGTLNLESLPKERQNQLKNMDVPSWVAIAHALPSWLIIEPEKVLCPVLMLAGSENPDSISGNEPYLNKLQQNKIEYKILEGLNHWREFTESKITLPLIINFLNNS
ncbi:alpha/beta hydrolase [Candidatus Bathyarchaeota archaeon]|nr:alpha/beta hydrolase [Candidatus Bathyarchaeota archaeon]